MEKTNQPILLSLDLGTATGWALSNKHGRIMSGTAHFRPVVLRVAACVTCALNAG